jgi:tetratricopeptide (TPR) repeat protein
MIPQLWFAPHAADISDAPPRALYHRGLAHLLMGNFEAGWADYEHRLAVPDFRHRVFDRPRWDGASLTGKRLLVICEQGYGDVFQFVRFLPQLRTLAGEVIFECPAELRDTLAPVLHGLTIVPLLGRNAPDVAFDCYVSLLSLPMLLGIGLASIPAPAAYLFDARPPARTVGDGLRIGVCWAGKPSHPQDLHRSMDPEYLAAIASVPGVTLVSLQKDVTQRPPLPGLCSFLRDPDTPLVDFLATARVMADLDLIVTVDTSVAHLAAGMGRPVWLLLSRACDWRWMTQRSDTPWYPTMRLFRQPKLGDWSAVMADVRAALLDPSTQPARSDTPAVSAGRVRLDDVTLCCVDTLHHEAALHAIRRSRAACDFGAVLFLTDKDIREDGVDVVTISTIERVEDYSRIIMRDLVAHIRTSHVLIVQWDGYVVDSRMWDPGFLSFDYIGAVWPFHDDDHRVGNGGFSLRSRRLMEALGSPGFPPRHPEDDAICRIYRPALEARGFRFADEATAERFSVEVGRRVGPTFGFHGVFNLWRFVSADDLPAFLDRVDPKAFVSTPSFTLLANYAVVGRWQEADALLRRMSIHLDRAAQVQGLAAVLQCDLAEAERLIERIDGAGGAGTSVSASVSRAEVDAARDWVRKAERHHVAGRLDLAWDCYDRALALDPRNADALHMRGVLKMMRGEGPVGVIDIRTALAIRPTLPNAWRNLTHYYLMRLLSDDTSITDQLCHDAESAARLALDHAPGSAECHYHLAAILCRIGRYPESIAAGEQAIRLDPGHIRAHMTLALARLVTGDLPGGFAAYEWRWRMQPKRAVNDHDPALAWNGDVDPSGRTILLHAEQGHGDTIQMIRYVPAVLTKGARVVLLVHPGLKRLISETSRRWPDGVTVVTEGEEVPAFDLHCPLMRLPRIFGTTLQTILAEIPYLHADPDRVAAWRRRLDALPSGLKIGVVWTGDPAATMNARRSIPLTQLAPLSDLPGTVLVSLQKGPGTTDVIGASIRLHDWTSQLADFADTAALIGALDLVISVDTAVAHLTGALGRPVWLLNRRDTDWRWLLEREDSPWYPTLRQFRQVRDGDWAPVVARIRDTLEGWVEKTRI